MTELIPTQKKIKAIISVPGSKSYTNRALLLAALAKGKSIIVNPLESDDTKYMAFALQKMGIRILKKNGALHVFGAGGKFRKPSSPLFLGNAGSAVRFLTAVLCVADIHCEITGDKRMQQRPVKDLLLSLQKLGAVVESKNNTNCPPVIIKKGFSGGQTEIRGKDSSQYLSALLMASPLAKRPVTIKIKGNLTSLPYVTMTLQIMKDFGVSVKNSGYKKFFVQPSSYKSCTYEVEADASSATYPLGLAAMHNGTVTISNLGSKSKQADITFLKILKKMGCSIKTTAKTITILGPKKLKPLGTVNLNRLPDAAMTIAILCAFARGKSTLKNIGNLRIKETDRLSALARELQKIGCKVKEGKNFLQINGDPKSLHGSIIETYNDHRMAMCFAVAGSKIPNVKITNPECVSKTYPGFWKDLKKIGIHWKKIKDKKSNIVVGGLRGSGKTELGKAIAKMLNHDFIDTDELIEKAENKKIAAIVKEKGWQYFRGLERAVVKKLQKTSNSVISTGGGVFLHKQNIKILKKNGMVVILTCDPKVAAQRIKGDRNRPPLTAQKSLVKELKQLWAQRRANYYKAGDLFFDTTMESTNLQQDSIIKATKVLSLLKHAEE